MASQLFMDLHDADDYNQSQIGPLHFQLLSHTGSYRVSIS